MAQSEITGNTKCRSTQAAVLLHLVDPVRGEPTAYSLDRDFNEIEPQRERQLKRKFLNTLALVSATRKDGDTVSAASFEEGLPEGTVVRVASNEGAFLAFFQGRRTSQPLCFPVTLPLPSRLNIGSVPHQSSGIAMLIWTVLASKNIFMPSNPPSLP
jgi:hypothetical protein